MSTYSPNLNDNVEDSFPFEAGGHQYRMTYPTLEEIEQLQSMIRESQTKITSGEMPEDDGDFMEWTYKFISPVDESSPHIRETMKKQNIRVAVNYTEMLKTEFGIGE